MQHENIVKFIEHYKSDPGYLCVVTEKIDYFLAPYYAADRVADGGGLVEEQENILVHELPLADLWRRFEAQQLQDGKLVILLLTLRARHPALFEPLSEN